MLIVNVLLRQKCAHKSGAKVRNLFELDNDSFKYEFLHKLIKHVKIL